MYIYDRQLTGAVLGDMRPTSLTTLPKGLTLVQHFQIRRTCSKASSWTSDSGSRLMSPADMNPGFISTDDRIVFDRRFDESLIDLLVKDKDYRKFLAPGSVAGRRPSVHDKIRIALVDLTGKKICGPGYAGWGSTTPMRGASTAKIAIVYAIHQLLFDLREMVNASGIRRAADLILKADDAWKALTCKPDLRWLFTFTESAGPLKVDKSATLDNHLRKMIDASFSSISTPIASELILRVGFEYIASVLWRSGLRHPAREGLWFGNTFCPGPISAKPDLRCHKSGCPVVWAKNPLPAKGIFLTALSVATFFTLLAQGRLVNEHLSRDMEALLAKGCSWLYGDLPSATVRAAKCGVVAPFRHDAGLIEDGALRYVLVYLTQNLTMSDGLRARFVRDLDWLVKKNNPP